MPNSAVQPFSSRFSWLTHRGLLVFLLGALLGVFVITNTWDTPLYGVLGVLCIIWTGWKDRRQLLWGVLPLPLAVLVALPYLRLFKAQVQGAQVEIWSPPAASFWLLWGGFLVLWLAVLPARLELKADRTRFLIVASVLLMVALLTRPYTSFLTVMAVLGLTVFVLLRPQATPKEVAETNLDNKGATAKIRKNERRKKSGQQQPEQPLVGEAETVPSPWEDARRFRSALAVLGLLALLAPMLFYIVGFFSGDLRHQDTVFKFGQQAWLLLGTAAICEALALWSKPVTPWQRTWRWPIAVLLASFLTMPLLGSASVIWSRAALGDTNNVPSLDGARYLPESDRKAIEWLNNHAAPGAIVLEAVNKEPSGSYVETGAEAGRIAWLTGVPTPLGWPQHVNFWGGQWDVIQERWQTVRNIYAWPDNATARAALQRLRVRYVFVGTLEQRSYDPDALSRLRAALPVVFEDGDTFITEVPPAGGKE